MIAKNGKEVMSVYKNGKLLNSVWVGDKKVWPGLSVRESSTDELLTELSMCGVFSLMGFNNFEKWLGDNGLLVSGDDRYKYEKSWYEKAKAKSGSQYVAWPYYMDMALKAKLHLAGTAVTGPVTNAIGNPEDTSALTNDYWARGYFTWGGYVFEYKGPALSGAPTISVDNNSISMTLTTSAGGEYDSYRATQNGWSCSNDFTFPLTLPSGVYIIQIGDIISPDVGTGRISTPRVKLLDSSYWYSSAVFPSIDAPRSIEFNDHLSHIIQKPQSLSSEPTWFRVFDDDEPKIKVEDFLDVESVQTEGDTFTQTIPIVIKRIGDLPLPVGPKNNLYRYTSQADPINSSYHPYFLSDDGGKTLHPICFQGIYTWKTAKGNDRYSGVSLNQNSQNAFSSKYKPINNAESVEKSIGYYKGSNYSWNITAGGDSGRTKLVTFDFGEYKSEWDEQSVTDICISANERTYSYRFSPKGVDYIYVDDAGRTMTKHYKVYRYTRGGKSYDPWKDLVDVILERI